MRRGAITVFCFTLAACGCSTGSPVDDVTVDFGDVGVSGTATKTFTLHNDTGSPVELIAVVQASNGFAVKDFTPRSIPAHGSLELTATLTPPRAGQLQSKAVLTTSAARGITVTFTGTGIAGRCDVPQDLDFGPVQVGDTARLPSLGRIEPIAPFGFEGQEATFTPTEPVEYLTVVVMQPAPECPATPVTLHGTGEFSVLRCEPETTDFGFVSVGDLAQKRIKVANASRVDKPLSALRTVTEMQATSWFTVEVPPNPVVPAQGSLELTLTLAPQLPRSILGTLHADPHLACALKANANGPQLELEPGPLDFGSMPYFPPPASNRVVRTLTVKNPGTLPLEVRQVTVTGLSASSGAGDVCVEGCQPQLPFVVPPGGSKNLTVALTPAAANLQLEYELSFVSNLTVPRAVRVVGSTVTLPPCGYTVSPPGVAALDFGQLPAVNPRELTFTLKNQGSVAGDDCLVSQVDLSAASGAAFSLPLGPYAPRTLHPQESLEVLVRASPTATGNLLHAERGDVSARISSPTAPDVSFALRAHQGETCIWVSVSELDFGAVPVSCAAPVREVTVFNACPAAVPISTPLVWGAGFSLVNPPRDFPSGPTVLQVRYQPGIEPARGALQLPTGVTTELETVRLAGRPGATQEEKLVVPQLARVDVLVVLDDSCSMQGKATQIQDQLGQLPGKLAAASVDYHLGVIAGECMPASGKLHGPWVGAFDPNAPQKFREALSSDWNNGDHECLPAPLLAALSPERVTGENAGFLRSFTPLEVIFVSDMDEDWLGLPVPLLAAKLRAKVPEVRVSAIDNFGACPGAVDLTHLASIVSTLGGDAYPLCASDWSPLLDALVTRVTHDDGVYPLKGEPSGPPTVTVDFAPVTRFIYDPGTRTVSFPPAYRPVPGSTVRVSYTPACH